MTDKTQVYSTFIHANAERIWQAITEGDETQNYFYNCRITSDFTPGSSVIYGDAENPAASGVIESCEPPYRLVMSWRSHWCGDFDDEPASRVTWEITPLGDICKVVLLHDQLEQSPHTAEAVAGGWGLIIAGLKTLVETGQAMPSPDSEAIAS